MLKLSKAITTRTSRFTQIIIAVIVAVVLVVSPIGTAIALQVVRGGNADSSAYQSGVGTGSSYCESVIEQAYEQGVSGASALDNYLNGVPISEESALSIDTGALSAIDADIAAEIGSLQSSLINGTYESGAGEDYSSDYEEPYEEPYEEESTYDDSAYVEEPEDTYDYSVEEEVVVPESTNNSSGGTYEQAPSGGSSSNNNSSGTSTNNSTATEQPSSSGDSGSSAGSGSSGSSSQWTYSGNNSYTPKNIGVSLTTTKFIAVIGEPARKIARENGLYASVMIAQAILESGSGNSSLSSMYNNIFGIKGRYNGDGVVMRTSEDDGTGHNYSISSVFRSYPTLADSLSDYADLLTNSMGSFYSPTWKANTQSYIDACNYLEGHYATDTSYSEKLQDLINTYDLTRYDKMLDYAMVNTYEMPVLDSAGKQVIDPETGLGLTEQRDLVDLVIELTSHLGEDYVWGGTTPGSFDCSGLVQYCYRKTLGIQLPRTTYEQCLLGTDVDFDDLHMGDLLFFTYSDGSAGHVAVYLGEDCFIEAPRTGDVIKVTSMTEKMPSFAKRIVDTTAVEVTDDETGTAVASSTASSTSSVALSADGTINIFKRLAATSSATPEAVETKAYTAAENLINRLAELLTSSIVVN